MPEYRVVWAIDLEASTPQAAALMADEWLSTGSQSGGWSFVVDGVEVDLADARYCLTCGELVLPDAQGAWVDATDGDGCDSPSGAHTVEVEAGA